MRRFYASAVCIMPKGLKRYYGDGHLHFLTFSCHRRLPLLNTLRAHEKGEAGLVPIGPAG